MDKISFVIPCFNNEDNIDDLFTALFENEKQFSETDFEYILVDDTSEDRTFEALERWKISHSEKVKLLQMSKNIGSHKAVFSGLNLVTGDCIIVMAADLQDPPELSKEMHELWKQGSKLVLGVKENQQQFTSKLFHSLMKFLVKQAPNSAFDYALFDKCLLPKLQTNSVKNCNFFYRLVDLQSEFSIIYYTKQKRKKGKSGWTFFKKLLFFTENIIAYSLAKFRIAK